MLTLIGDPFWHYGVERNKDIFRLAEILLKGYATRAGFIAELLTDIFQGFKGEIAGIEVGGLQCR